MVGHPCFGAECPTCSPFSLKSALPLGPPDTAYPPPDPLSRASKLATFCDSRGLRVHTWPTQIVPSTTIIILDRGAHPPAWTILVHQRADNGHWGLIGGAQEVGESIEACARREALEETGLVVILDCLVCVDSDPCQYAIGLYPTGARQFCNLTFLARAVPGRLCPSRESRQLEWVTTDHLPQPFLPAHRWRLEQAMQGPTLGVPVR